MTISDEIERLRDKLNKSIANNDDYDTVYTLSTKLDVLINIYYIEEYPKRNRKRVS